MNDLTPEQGVALAADVARRHDAPMCVVLVIDPRAGRVRADSFGCNPAVCAVTARLADHLVYTVQKWTPGGTPPAGQ